MEKNSIETLLSQIAELENKLLEAQETIEAIKYDKIDALVVSTPSGERIYTLESAESPYRIFLEQMNEGAITLSDEGVILFCNKRFADMIQAPLEHILGTQIHKWIMKEEVDALSLFLGQESDKIKEEIRFMRPDGSCVSSYLSLTKLFTDGADPVLCVVATDLTEKKYTEEILAAEKLARSILEQAAEAIVVCDENLRIIRASKAAETLAGEPVIYKLFDTVLPLFDEQKNSITLRKLLNNLKGSQTDATLIKNSYKYNLILNIGVLSGSLNNPLGYVINLTNITQHIEAEEKLSQSLKEKTILLKEIHHRVKNNLQIISSLLRLQSLYVPEEHLQNILNECQNRINSMALIHQKLYESKSFAAVNISDYLHELIVFLCNTYMVRSDSVELILLEEDISFSIDSAIPLGLVLNELVTNSFKHAFTDKEKTKVTVKITLPDGDNVNISIRDNGVGFPDDINFYNPSSLGLQLVHSLTEQVNGKIKLIVQEGTEILITIPRDQIQP